MNRVRVLLLGLLALFFYSPSYAATYGEGQVITSPWTVTGTGSYSGDMSTVVAQLGYNIGANAYYTYNFLSVKSGTETSSVQKQISAHSLWVCRKEIATGIYSWGGKNISESTVHYTTYYNWLASLPVESSVGYATAPDSALCGPAVCDVADDDSDGICNSCDSSPGEPDKKHCIWYQFKVPFSDTVLFSMIDRSGNCDGSNTVITSNKTVPNATNTSSWNGYFTTMKYEINPPNCGGDDGNGECKCDYDYDDEPLLHDQEIVIDVALTDDLINQLQQNDNDLDDDKPNDCTTLKSNCSSSCATRGGVAASTCYTKDGQSYSNCTCSDDYNYSINNPVINDSTSDTNDNGSSDDTGGSDSNSDGVDDFYAAVKGAIKDSGILTKQDVTNSNLGQISDDIGVVNSNINKLGTKLDGIDSGIDGLGGKLDSINDKLGQGFEATGDAALPSSNDYDSDVENIDEDNLGEAIGNFISGGLPFVSYFKGTYIDIGSSSPVLSTEIYGKSISIDFTGLEDILNNMGLVLGTIVTVLAFMIIVHKG